MSDLSIITQALVDLLAGDATLGLKKVYYGETTGIPEVPSAAIEIAGTERAYTQTGLQTTLDIKASVIIYHGLVDDSQVIKKALDQFTQAVEDKLHKDVTLGGLVISGIVSNVEPGVVAFGKALFYAHRLTWEAIIKERIGV